MSGVSTVVAVLGGPAIAELRRLTGLTWDQRARLLGVGRRSPRRHGWTTRPVGLEIV